MLGYYDSQNRTRKGWAVLVGLVVLSLLVTGCGAPKAKTYTIGVVHSNATLDPVLVGFKARMTELGYVEGKNVTYAFHGVLKNEAAAIDADVKTLMDQKVDMFFTLGTIATQSAKKAVAGTKVPVVFAPVVNPVAEGVVDSISRPGGNVTGIQRGNVVGKSLEWLLKVAPGTKKVYLFYNPADVVSVTTMQPLPDAASKLGVEFVPTKVTSEDQVLAAIQTLPKEAAIFYIPAPTIDDKVADICKAAMERGIPLGTYLLNDVNKGALVGYGATWDAVGKQAARIADQVLKGTKPADLPVETDEAFLGINLKTANTIGLNIPDEILRQANTVIR